MRAGLLATSGLLCFALASCAVGPNYHEPSAPRTDSFVHGHLPDSTASAPVAGGEAQHFEAGRDLPGDWWTLFRSAELDDLIRTALARNPTLEAAQAALREANENLAAARGSYLPALSGSAGATRQRVSGAAFGSPQSFMYTLNNASVNVSYTLDAFGGVRRQVEALRAQAEYQRFSLEGAYLTLTANIVTAAIAEGSLHAQIEATRKIAAAQREELVILRHRVADGAATRADLLQQQALLAATLASLPPLDASLARERNLLATYTGSLPADFAARDFDLDRLALPVDLPVSLPSRLVEQRPDVRAYAALLHSATAEVGVATADLLPKLTLTGSYGAQAPRFADLFSPAATVWSLAGSVAQPLFEGGRLLHARRAAVAAAQQAAANYRATVLDAFAEVSDALLALEADARSVAAEASAERAAADSLTLVRAQYASGAVNRPQVLLAEQSEQSAAIALVKARAQRYADTAALYQALGGGWWHRDDAQDPSQTSHKGHL
ncbi:MAG: efflux transporter outer membrane subunit [Gammaproteobacteria bacterium]|nr:efflux transporter outer membrane subunit [Gammaproteobacteria bacterium]